MRHATEVKRGVKGLHKERKYRTRASLAKTKRQAGVSTTMFLNTCESPEYSVLDDVSEYLGPSGPQATSGQALTEGASPVIPLVYYSTRESIQYLLEAWEGFSKLDLESETCM